MVRVKAWLILVVLLGCWRAWGQSAVPALMRGQMPSSSFASTTEPTNVFQASISASLGFDDNVTGSPSNHIAGAQYNIAGSLAFQQTRRHMRWNLSYHPSAYLGNPHSLNQSFGTTLELDPTQRMSIQLRQDYMVTSDPFDRIGTAALQPGIGLLEHPNDVVALPQLKWSSLFSEATVAYRTSRHTTVGLNGSYAVLHYTDYQNAGLAAGLLNSNTLAGENTGLTAGLINSNTAIGDAFVSHDFSPRYTSGVEYRFMDLQLSLYNMRSRTHSVLWFQQFTLTPRQSLVFFAGPEYSQSQEELSLSLLTFQLGTPVSSQSWSPSMGGVYIYRAGHRSLRASYMHRVSDGGGYIGVVRMDSGSIGVAQKLAHHWSASLTAEAVQETSIFNHQDSTLRVLRAGLGVTREINTNTLLRLTYDRIYQHGAIIGYALGNHNRVMVSVQHTFNKPLGR